MSERSSAISLGLLLAPTLCVVAIRFGLPALEEVISQDYLLEISIHALALSLGALMLYRYLRVEDHEFHRSRAIRRLSKTYKSEDRGLWEEKTALCRSWKLRQTHQTGESVQRLPRE